MNFLHPLRLSVGNHVKGSGEGCVQNIVSYMNGDTEITDSPACSDPFLSVVNQKLNDNICKSRDGNLLCPVCTQIVLPFGFASEGTAGVATKAHYVELGIMAARDVAHLNPDPRVEAAIVAAETWLKTPSPGNAARDARTARYDRAARTAARDARAAARDAHAAGAAASVTYAARAAGAAASVTYAAPAADATGDADRAARAAARDARAAAYAAHAAGDMDLVGYAELWHTRWQQVTGHQLDTTKPDNYDTAINQMMATP